MAPTVLARKEPREKKHGGEKRADLQVKVKYTNNLPDLPFDPKFINYPFDPNRFVEYKQTSLERAFKWDILTEHDLGVSIDLINSEAYRAPAAGSSLEGAELGAGPAALDPEDEKLLEEEVAVVAETKRSALHQTPQSWLRRTEYMSAEYNRFHQSSAKSEAKIGYRIRKELEEAGGMYKDRDKQIATINKTFEIAKAPITAHHSKPGVTPLEVLPVFPDFQMWGYPYAQVIFDSEPVALPPPGVAGPSGSSAQAAPKLAAIEDMSQAVIRGMQDESGDQFVAYFLPTEETKQKKQVDFLNGKDYEEDEEYTYKMSREYNWTVKHKGTRGYEETYFLVMRPDGVYYNELETRVRLSKRRVDKGPGAGGRRTTQVPNTTLAIRHRPFNEQELAMQEARLALLEPPAEAEEEVEEEEEEEAEEGGAAPPEEPAEASPASSSGGGRKRRGSGASSSSSSSGGGGRKRRVSASSSSSSGSEAEEEKRRPAKRGRTVEDEIFGDDSD